MFSVARERDMRVEITKKDDWSVCGTGACDGCGDVVALERIVLRIISRQRVNRYNENGFVLHVHSPYRYMVLALRDHRSLWENRLANKKNSSGTMVGPVLCNSIARLGFL